MKKRTSLHAFAALVTNQLGRLGRIFSRETIFKHFGVTIALMSFLLGVVTYVLLTDDMIASDAIDKFYWILGLDVLLLMAMTFVVGLRVRDVWQKRKQHMAGAQMHTQLMTIFSALVTVPALLVTIFAVVFIHYGVQSWFGENIKTAVSESQKVAQSYLKEHQQSIRADMLAMANDMNREATRLVANKEILNEFFQTQVYLRNLSEAIMVDSSGNVHARAGLSFSIEFLPDNFSTMIEKANTGQVVMLVGDNDDRVRALVKLDNFIDSYLFVGRFVDENVLSSIRATNEAADTYATLEARQTNLKINMSLIFVLVTLMLLLVAIWAGLSLAERIIMPVTRLIQAAERVRSGDLNARVSVGKTENEVTVLARAFNRMTDQLSAQRRDLLNANIQLDERRRFTEAVLTGVNAGILGMDDKGVIQIANASSLRLLKREEYQVIGKKLADICPEMEKVRRVLRSKPGRSVETPIDVQIAGQEKESHWIIRMTADGRVADNDNDQNAEELRGYVATFDDLSPLIQAQRQAAWSDVARRVAHEIKNPLTPIQLSAERLKRRYSKQIVEDPDTFLSCTDTIIRSVDDIRHMVDEFSNFARMPESSKKAENLVTLCQHVMVLFQQGHRDAEFRFNRPDQAMRAIVDRQQLTQALTNLIKNAYEAAQEYAAQENQTENTERKPCVTLDVVEQDNQILLTISDNGAGWPQDLLPRLTDPYVTTKTTGTGLGLAIVAKIVEDHAGRLEFLNNTPNGAIIRVYIPKGDIQNG